MRFEKLKNSIFDRIKAFFARDPSAYWWSYFSDEERELGRMDVWQLASEIQNATGSEQIRRRIVAEHMLNMRLARIQSRAAWGAGALSFLGALLGAVLSVTLIKR